MQKFKTESRLLKLGQSQEVLERLEKEYALLIERLKHLMQAQKDYLTAKKQNAPKLTLTQLKEAYLELKRQLGEQQKRWQYTLLQVA